MEQPPALDAPTEQAPEAVTNVIQMADARPGVKAMAAKLLAWMDATETTEIPATTKIAKVTGYAKGYAGAAADLVRQELAARERTA